MKKYIFLLLALMLSSCTKNYLDKRSTKSLLVPTTLDDFQKLLDSYITGGFNNVTGLNEIASDDLITSATTLQTMAVSERNSYLWKADVYEGSTVKDWNNLYKCIFACNVVLEGLEKLDRAAEQASYDRIRGFALFHRSMASFSLAQMFAPVYDRASAKELPGIPLRLSANVNEITGRGKLEDTYMQIEQDLQIAAELLPETVPFKSRPVKAAAWGMLARLYLIMDRYNDAKLAARQAIAGPGKLIDYNIFKPATTDSPFPRSLPYGNDEVLFYTGVSTYSFFIDAATQVSPTLYSQYQANDLRKTCFFSSSIPGINNYVGSYTGSYASLFGGPAIDEQYLILAECEARTGERDAALNDLNTLLIKRWKTGTFTPLTASSDDELLRIILNERRKELIGRGIRWTDLRRLNKDPKFAITLTRTVGNQIYTLPPGDKRYIFPIPDDEVNRSGIEQNPK